MSSEAIKAIEALKIAKEHVADSASMFTSAEVCYVDALNLFKVGDYVRCIDRCKDSLKYSLGILSPVYQSLVVYQEFFK